MEGFKPHQQDFQQLTLPHLYLIVVLPSCDLQVQEDYIKDELKNLRTEYLYAQEEVKRIQSVPLVIGQFLEAVDQNYAIVGSTTGE